MDDAYVIFHLLITEYITFMFCLLFSPQHEHCFVQITATLPPIFHKTSQDFTVFKAYSLLLNSVELCLWI